MAKKSKKYDDAWETNIKRFVDEWGEVSHNKAVQNGTFQDSVNQQYLRFVEDQHTLVMRTADSGALVANRAANNAATLDILIAAGEVDTTAQGAIGAKIAEEVKNATKAAMDAALAGLATTGAVSQGALETQVPVELAQVLTNNNTIQTALLAELSQINKALSVILVKVTADELVEE